MARTLLSGLIAFCFLEMGVPVIMRHGAYLHSGDCLVVSSEL